MENPKSQRQESQCYGLARITSKELAPIHSVKNGILQNAFSASQRVGVDIGKSALTRIDRLMNSLANGHKRMMREVQWLMLKKNEQHQRTGRPVFGRLLIKYTTIGLRVPGHGAAEVFIDFSEELKHTDTNPMCKIHQSRCTSR